MKLLLFVLKSCKVKTGFSSLGVLGNDESFPPDRAHGSAAQSDTCNPGGATDDGCFSDNRGCVPIQGLQP